MTAREANRAIYFDFEGRKDEPPAIMGVYSTGWQQQFVLDKTLAPFAKVSRIAGQRVFQRTLAAVVEEALLKPAQAEDRRLVAFSEHELRVLHHWAGPNAATQVASRFLNARDFAAAWVTRHHPDVRQARDPRALCDFVDLCGFEWPEEFLVEPANALLKLRRRSRVIAKTNGSPDHRTMELWTRLLGYNRLDCHATRHVVLHAIRDAKEAAGSRRRQLASIN